MTLIDLIVILGLIPYVCLASFTYTALVDLWVPLWPEWFSRLCAVLWPITLAVALLTMVPLHLVRAEARFLRRQMAQDRLRRENATIRRGFPTARVR